MSAFVMSEGGINRIVAGLLHKTATKEAPVPEGILRVEDDATGKALAEILFQLNVESVRARYGEDADEAGIIPPGFTYRPVEPPTDVQLYKDLECWLYQSCESGAVRQDPVYRAVEEYLVELASSIVHRMREYEWASWGE